MILYFEYFQGRLVKKTGDIQQSFLKSPSMLKMYFKKFIEIISIKTNKLQLIETLKVSSLVWRHHGNNAN